MLLLLLIMVPFSIFAGLVEDHSAMIKRYKVGDLNEQVFCYGQDQGFQVSKSQRIASLTKLITSLQVFKSLNLDKRYATRVFITQDKLHIEGSRDPYFEEEKLILMLQALNQMGLKNVKTLSFNSDFLFYDLGLESHKDITPAMVRSRLVALLNGKPTTLKAHWQFTKTFSDEEGIKISSLVPVFKADQILVSDVNPLAALNPVVLEHKSLPLYVLLKSMNVQSKNIVAQNLFVEAGKVRSLESVLSDLGLEQEVKIYNGSGLPMDAKKRIRRNKRLDNTSSCTAMLRIIDELRSEIVHAGFRPSDIMAVAGGHDLGSFRQRFKKYPEVQNAVLAKTGTLMHTSSLAGVLMVGGDEIPFAILNHSTNVAQARLFQDEFVTKLFGELGAPTAIPYQKISIFPWSGEDFFQKTPARILLSSR